MRRPSYLLLAILIITATAVLRKSTADEFVAHSRLVPADVSEGDWPWWRGTARSGIAESVDAPITWTETDNVVWKVAVPGRGHATPSIWGEQIFVSTADNDKAASDDAAQSLLCYRRQDGQLLWTAEIHRGGFMHTHHKNSHASPTPACDGQRVFLASINRDALWIAAIDLDGKIDWQKQVGEFNSEHGYGSSPVIYGDLVIVAADSRGVSHLTALKRATGEEIWQIERGGGVTRAGDGSYGTPIVARIAGRDQLLLSGRSRVVSYDPLTGNELWSVQGPAETTANTIAFSGDLVFVGGGYPENGLMCIRADGTGDVTETHIQWHLTDLKAYVPTPIAVGDRLIVARDNGVIVCLEAETGKQIWSKRMGGAFSASPVLAGDNVYIPNEAGKTFVFKLADQFQLVAENDLGDGGFASPVFSNGKLFLRTDHHLYCIASSDTP